MGKDVIVSVAAITGAAVAVLGLGTWRRQLRGHSEYDLARRILVSLFRYRDAIHAVRHPVMWAHEIPEAPADQAKQMSRDQKRFYGTSQAYQARWNKVNDERTTLYADLLHAEALWGKELTDLFQTLFKLQHELLVFIRSYLSEMDPDSDAARKEAIHRIQSKRRDIMYDGLGDEDDEFKKEFQAAS